MEGYMPHQAKTAEECLAKVKELGGKLDAIVIDGRLASDRGKMLIVNIRSMDRKAKIFVLAERFEVQNKTRVLDYGADEFTIKPLSINTLVSKVNMLLLQGTPEKA
jgi:DNA-binding response OmpR family regulator